MNFSGPDEAREYAAFEEGQDIDGEAEAAASAEGLAMAEAEATEIGQPFTASPTATYEEQGEPLLVNLLPVTMNIVRNQLLSDDVRYGDEWRHRSLQNQENRIMKTILGYYEEFQRTGKPIPWAKVIGNAHIAILREQMPELIYPDARP